MEITKRFVLERPARKSGGDRYAEVEEVGKPMIMGATYVLQVVSRHSERIEPIQSLSITIDTESP